MSTTHEQSAPTYPETAHGGVVVAVDGSEGNHQAVVWAADEAAALGSTLVMLSATGDFVTPMPHAPVAGWADSHPERTRAMLRRIQEELVVTDPNLHVRRWVHTGDPVAVILDGSEHADLVVLGKRGQNAFSRVIVGSTSIAVAGRSTNPVVIVPDEWDGASTHGAIVVGLDLGHRDVALLRRSFERAQRLDVPLIAVYAWRALPLYDWSPADLADWSDQAAATLEETLHGWRAEYPEVEVELRHPRAHPAHALLEAASDAQLVMLGRHTGERHLGGLGMGSVTRAVLHYTPCPVMVVPVRGDTG